MASRSSTQTQAGSSTTTITTQPANGSREKIAIQYAQQAEKLSQQRPVEGQAGDVALEAKFVTPRDPVIVTTDGNRLPAVPLQEAHKLNMLREDLQSDQPATIRIIEGNEMVDPIVNGENSEGERVITVPSHNGKALQKAAEGNLNKAIPPSHTNPLFPPLPLYGPPSILRTFHCWTFRASSFFLSLSFLGVIVLGSLFTSIPPFLYRIYLRLTLRNPDADRPFYEEEMRRNTIRKEKARKWRRRRSDATAELHEDMEGTDTDNDGFEPTEGGPDPIVCDVGYYARRVGLDVEEFQVQTEDGFIIDLWHVYDPKEYTSLPAQERAHRGPELFTEPKKKPESGMGSGKPKFPVLLLHGLLQSSGAYCVNDDDSLAFYLCKSGYDVWLGNNRCGFKPKHTVLEYSDPRMWCWNIRQMGVFDLPALTSRVLYETGFAKIGLVCHSQGTTQTFVALAKEQRPELGEKLTVFCALAPAVYAGPLIGKMYFKFMRVISPAMFRLMFGIHAFIPIMMTMHRLLHARVYGWLGYKVFSFLFNWTDRRWDRGVRDRMFQFAPVYVSAESMRWWLGRECFAKQKCILATKEEWRAEEREDIEADHHHLQHDQQKGHDRTHDILTAADWDREGAAAVRQSEREARALQHQHRRRSKGATAWYNAQAPPFALWVCGRDALVDGNRLLRRLERGREPHVAVVHSKVLPEYEHLDVIWAMDAPEEVFREVREVLWKTCDVRDVCRVPRECEDVGPWERPKLLMPPPVGMERESSQSSSGEESPP